MSDAIPYYLISDTHFGHHNLEKWGNRSGDWQEQLYKGINAIPKESVLIHLGDICIGNDKEAHELLMFDMPNMAILVRGNHDKKSAKWYLDHGWDLVVDTMSIEYMGQNILLSHRPMHPDMWRFTKNIHGHTHGNMHRAEEYLSYYSKDFHIDISPEIVGYQPLRLDTIIKKI